MRTVFSPTCRVRTSCGSLAFTRWPELYTTRALASLVTRLPVECIARRYPRALGSGGHRSPRSSPRALGLRVWTLARPRGLSLLTQGRLRREPARAARYDAKTVSPSQQRVRAGETDGRVRWRGLAAGCC